MNGIFRKISFFKPSNMYSGDLVLYPLKRLTLVQRQFKSY